MGSKEKVYSANDIPIGIEYININLILICLCILL